MRLLAGIIGETRVSSEGSSIAAFPGSAEEISEILKVASSERWSVMPAGGMTWLNLQSGLDANVIVSTIRLDQIIEHEPADLIAVAQAGVKLSNFNAKLKENGQWLPLDPPDDGRATIGGIVAAGLGGAQQFGYGRPRGSVIGMKVVLADGSMIKAGGRVVKNVAGYDLCKLFTGSFGSLGIITEVNFKLRPRPAREATVVATGKLSDLVSGAAAILEARLFPVAAEIVSPAFASRLSITTSSPVLLVRFAGNEKGVAFQIEQAMSRLENATVETDDARLWQSLAAAPFWSDYPSGSSASVLPGDLLRIVGQAPSESIWQIGALDGRIHGYEIRTAAEDGSVMRLMQRVKEKLDPFTTFARTSTRIDTD
jgi:FAD/FMN-containing dehydrogenase